MNCQNFTKLTDEFIETGVLNAEAEKHASECKECGLELEALKELRAALKTEDAVKIPRNFNAKVWEKIGEPAPSLLPSFFSPGLFMKTAAAALIVMAGVVFVMNPGTEKIQTAVKTDEGQINTAKADEKQIKTEKKDVQIMTAKTDEKMTAEVRIKTDEKIKTEKTETADKTVLAVTGGNTSSGGVKLMEIKPARVITETASENSVSSASSEKSLRQDGMREPLEIRNNVIKPLTGERFSVKYLVSETADVKIIIYDIKGVPVKVLASAGQSAGVYEVFWNGTDESGRFVGDGTYIAYIKTGLTERKVKIAVVK